VWENLDVAALVRHAGRGHWNLDAVYDLFPETAELRSRQGGFCPVASSRC
jgi:ABC-type branched-subunit amino acid transport system ATPase component